MALVLEIRTTSKKAAKEIKTLATKAGASVKTLEKQSVTSSKRMTSSFSKLSGVLGGLGLGLGLIGVVKGFNSVVKAASDTEESLNKVREVFGEAAISVEKFSQTAAESLGASTESALAMTGEIGNLLVAMKFAEDDAADFSTEMVQLAADLGSFNNVPTADALNAIRSALVGESEPIRRFGADVRQTRLDQIALAEGIEFTKGKMSAQTKAIVAMKAILEDTRKAQGDFRRTSDGLANSQKILGAQFDDLQSVLGKKLMPVMKGAVDLLTGFIKAFTESSFDKAIGRLIELGADVSFVNQLKIQKQINNSLKRRIELAGEVNNFELSAIGNSNTNLASTRETMRLAAIIKITHDDDLKVLIETAKKTKETGEIQKLLTTVRKDQLEIATALGNHEVGIEKLSASQLLSKKGQLEVLTNITTQAIDFIGLLKEQETIEKRIKELKTEGGVNQNIGGILGEELRIRTAMAPLVEQSLLQQKEIATVLNNETVAALKEVALQQQKVVKFGNEFVNQTQTQILLSDKLVSSAFEVANGLGQALLNAKGLGDALKGVLKQLASKALGGLILGGISSFIPGGSFLGPLKELFGFQQGGSFKIPGPSTGADSQLVAFRGSPGETVTVTPAGGSTTNNNQKFNIIIQTQILDESFVRNQFVPMLKRLDLTDNLGLGLA